MLLKVQRRIYTAESTIGDLTLDGVAECHTLEPVVRAPGVKIFGKTAIPAGRYRVILDYSPHFARYLPHLLDVPNFAGVRIHSGNTAADTEGCILTGAHDHEQNRIVASHVAFVALWQKLAADDGFDAEHNIPRVKMKDETFIEILDSEHALAVDTIGGKFMKTGDVWQA